MSPDASSIFTFLVFEHEEDNVGAMVWLFEGLVLVDVTGFLVGEDVSGASDGDEVTGFLVGENVIAALDGDDVTGFLDGDEVTGFLDGDDVIVALVGDDVTGFLVGAVVIGIAVGIDDVVGDMLIVGDGVLNSNRSVVSIKCEAGKLPLLGHTLSR
jgi:hypothetical protein